MEEERENRTSPIKDPAMSDPTRKNIELRKVPWSQKEDDLLQSIVKDKGPQKWTSICESFPGRSASSCRHRWCYQEKKIKAEEEEGENRKIPIKPQWTQKEDDLLQSLAEKHDGKNWPLICESFPGRSASACRLRWCDRLSPKIREKEDQENRTSPIKDHTGKKGKWSKEEDDLLKSLVEKHKQQNWFFLSKSFLGRSAKSCRLRWCNRLSQEVDHSEEDSKLKRKCSAITPEGQNCDSRGNEGYHGNLEDEQPRKRVASGGGVSGVAAEVTASSSGEDPPSYRSLSLPSRVNESTQVDQHEDIDYFAELFPDEEEEEEGEDDEE